ncbi:MAG: type I restriction enzyme HsdR N-terminal domain-containing protein [Cyanobacteria bacterium P01_A01_bin.105]
MPTAVTQAITTLAEAEQLLGITRSEDPASFMEWQQSLPTLTATEQSALDELHRRYLYQRSEGHLLEGTVTLLFASPLLTVAGFYDPPFKLRAEVPVELVINDGEETLQGRIDVLVLKNYLWVVVLESKKTTLSAWSALPQTLAYLTANPDRPSFGLLTNGDDIIFVKLSSSQYTLSRVFAPLVTRQDLYGVMQVLKRLTDV